VTSGPGAPNDRAHMLFAFLLNVRLWLALARQAAEPVIEGLRTAPTLPPMAQWATFLRNHDELDLSRLTKEQAAEVFRAFAPKPEMQLFGRGVRRRLAPMLRDDRRRIELAYSLQFTMPGTPVIRYGEEIGMGENLALAGRDAIRTPMQWDGTATAGFSSADPDDLVRPVLATGRYGARRTNVESQLVDPTSLLRWFQHLIATLRMCPEIGVGSCTVIDEPLPPAVLAHRFDAPEGAILLLHNLGADDVVVDLSAAGRPGVRAVEVFSDRDYAPPPRRLNGLELSGYGYRWLRVRDR
jgi:maltose alpha-D-glucosyltransferase / alpha-amylase